MKTKETSTLYTTMSNNIGQVKRQDAQKEIERLNKQQNTDSWRIDESDFMFVEDETDDDVNNPCERMKGYVWVTCEPLITTKQDLSQRDLFSRQKALAFWKFLPSNKKLILWREYQKTTFTPSSSPDELTSREIEEIYKSEHKSK